MHFIYEPATLAIPYYRWYGVAPFGLSKQTMRQIERAYPVTNVLWHSDSHFASYNVDQEDEFCVPDRDDLRSIERDYPWVSDTWGPIQLTQFQASYCLMSIRRKSTKASRFPSTYSVKHDVEQVSGIYISEGALICVAQFAGFEVTLDGEVDVVVDDMHCCMLRVLNRAKNAITSRKLALV